MGRDFSSVDEKNIPDRQKETFAQITCYKSSVDISDYIPRLNGNKTIFLVYFGMRALVLIAAVLYLYDGNFSAAGGAMLVFLLMFVPSIVKRQFRIYLPFVLDFSIVLFIFGTLFLGHLVKFYDTVPFWDKFLHFQSGLVLSVTGFVLVYVLNERKAASLNLSPGFVALFAIAFSVAIGVFWEVGEFAGDWLFNGDWQGTSSGNDDTMWDLIADTAGAIIVSGIGYIWMYRYKHLPFAPGFFTVFRRAEKSQNTPPTAI